MGFKKKRNWRLPGNDKKKKDKIKADVVPVAVGEMTTMTEEEKMVILEARMVHFNSIYGGDTVDLGIPTCTS